MPARGQELCDHYMSALSDAQPALACMKDIQQQCLALGIPLKTRHREVAPNQYEMAPYFGTACTQIDQNLVVMQILEETAAKYGLACLLQSPSPESMAQESTIIGPCPRPAALS